jgi:hypothetical protein
MVVTVCSSLRKKELQILDRALSSLSCELFTVKIRGVVGRGHRLFAFTTPKQSLIIYTNDMGLNPVCLLPFLVMCQQGYE